MLGKRTVNETYPHKDIFAITLTTDAYGETTREEYQEKKKSVEK